MDGLPGAVPDTSEEMPMKRAGSCTFSWEGPSSCTFWFLNVAFLLSYNGKILPFFQEIRRRFPSALEKVTITYAEVVKGTYIKGTLAISHRWMTPDNPDPDGVQLDAIKTFLKNPAAKDITRVWIDAQCMPQDIPEGSRSAEDSAEFRKMLKQINMIFLGSTILILLDLSYISRFWTQFEAWIAMQMATPDGLRPAVGTKNVRHHIKCVQNAVEQADSHIEMLQKVWATRTPQKAHEFLAKPDVTVTNQSDKEGQLPKILLLNQIVRYAFKEMQISSERRQARAKEARSQGVLNAKAAREQCQAKALSLRVQRKERAKREASNELMHRLERYYCVKDTREHLLPLGLDACLCWGPCEYGPCGRSMVRSTCLSKDVDIWFKCGVLPSLALCWACQTWQFEPGRQQAEECCCCIRPHNFNLVEDDREHLLPFGLDCCLCWGPCAYVPCGKSMVRQTCLAKKCSLYRAAALCWAWPAWQSHDTCCCCVDRDLLDSWYCVADEREHLLPLGLDCCLCWGPCDYGPCGESMMRNTCLGEDVPFIRFGIMPLLACCAWPTCQGKPHGPESCCCCLPGPGDECISGGYHTGRRLRRMHHDLKHNVRESLSFRGEFHSVVHAMGMEPDDETLAVVCQIVNTEKDFSLRQQAIEKLGALGLAAGRESVLALCKALEKSTPHNPQLRGACISALGKVGLASGDESVAALSEILEAEIRTPSQTEQLNAFKLCCQALGNLGVAAGDEGAVVLLKALETPIDHLRADAAAALGKLGPVAYPEGFMALRERLEKEANANVRSAIEGALRELDPFHAAEHDENAVNT